MFVWIVIAIWILWAVFRLTYAVLYRLKRIDEIRKICEERKFKLRFNRHPFASFFNISKKPDIEIETPEKLFCIRLFSCIRKNWTLCFFDEDTVVFEKQYMNIRGIGAKYGRGRGKITYGTRVEPIKVRVLQSMQMPKSIKDIEKVMLFSIAPGELLRPNKERTRIDIIGNADKLFGYMAYDMPKFRDMLKEVDSY